MTVAEEVQEGLFILLQIPLLEMVVSKLMVVTEEMIQAASHMAVAEAAEE